MLSKFVAPTPYATYPQLVSIRELLSSGSCQVRSNISNLVSGLSLRIALYFCSIFLGVNPDKMPATVTVLFMNWLRLSTGGIM